jgi:hypothetical protein
MDDITAERAPKASPRIAADETARRREALRHADADSRIEGLFRSPESQPIFEAYVRGEIELEDILPRVKALHKQV